MYIKRNEKRYYLTEKELEIAYNEVQTAKDLQEIIMKLEESEDSEHKMILLGLNEDNEFAKNVAYRYRKFLNCGVNSAYQWTCIEDAFEQEKRKGIKHPKFIKKDQQNEK